MVSSILGKTLRWHQGGDWILDPVHVRADRIEYEIAQGPHAGRHAVQEFIYHRVTAGIETTAWCEENGAIVHITWFLESQTTRRFAAIPAWVAEDISVIIGDNRDPEFLTKMTRLAEHGSDQPRKIVADQGFFEIVDARNCDIATVSLRPESPA
jgi:phenolic acid decarboxylase